MNPEENYNVIVEGLTSFTNDYLIPCLMLIASIVFVVLAIVNGIRYAKATQEEDKQKAKKNLIGMVIGVAVCVAGVWLMPLLFNFFKSLFVAAPISG